MTRNAIIHVCQDAVMPWVSFDPPTQADSMKGAILSTIFLTALQARAHGSVGHEEADSKGKS